MSRFVGFCIYLCVPGIVWSACPEGFTKYLGPSSGLFRDVNGVCRELCGAGVTTLKTSVGYTFDLFATKNTDRAICVTVGDTTCYADLVSGGMSNTLNVKLGDEAYHANPDFGNLCPVRYTLSYSCGEGATGTPPESRELGWGDLYNRPDSAESCRYPGYSFNGWKIDSTGLSKGAVYKYTYTTDKTMTAQWKANTYAAPYLCNYCAGSTYYTINDFSTAVFGSNFTPKSSLPCTNPYKQTIDYYAVLDAFGKETGDKIIPGGSATWSWPGNIRLKAIWSEPEMGTSPSAPVRYTLSYSCGEGATGIPPESHSVGYNLGYYAPYDAGTCVKPGYYLSGWKIDSTGLSKGAVYKYTYTTDKTMTAQWKANTYAAPYLCNNGKNVQAYLRGVYAGSYTPSTTVCTSSDGSTFVGWRITDAYGIDTGDTVASGASFTWIYPYNIRLVAMWE